MVKRLILVALLIAAPAWAATEYLRPTADANGALSSLSCASGSDTTSSSMSAVYSSKSGNGPTGSSAQLPSLGSTNTYSDRVFSTWQSGHSESATTLYVSVAATTLTGDVAGCVFYSTNGGSSWTTLHQGVATTQTTYSATITGVNFSNLKVAVQEYSDPSSTIQVTTYDIWTTGTYNSATAPPFPGIIRDAFHRRRHKNRPILLARGQ